MDMIPVKSSQIHSIGHDPETGKLRVRFSDRTNRKTGAVVPGGTYEYDPHEKLPPLSQHHAGLLAADADDAQSVGSYFHQHIRKGGYVFRKLSEDANG